MNRVEKIKSTLITVLAIVGLVSFASPVFAASSSQAVANGFQISPLLTTLTVQKGQSQTVDIFLTNPTKDVSSARAIINNFVASADENGNPRLLLDNTPIPQNNFQTLVSPISNEIIQPGQQIIIPVKISVPANAYAGDYYGAIRFQPTSIGQSSTVGLTASVGTLFLITVPGNLVQKVELTQLTAAQNGNPVNFMASGGVQILTRLDNVGQIHEQPFGTILIKNIFGKTVASVELNNTNPRSNILADSIRKFVINVPNHHWFGRYTIDANLAYQQGSGNIISGTASFWYLPIWYILAALVIIAAIILIIYRMKARKKPNYKRS